MANTNKLVNIVYTAKEAVVYLTIASDGTEETDLLIYDSSAVAAEIAKINPGFPDPLTCRILEVYGSVAAASTARVKLEWDASTDVLAMDIPAGQSPTKANFRKHGGLTNQGGTGINGDILLTTTGLESGDTITIVLTVGAY